MSSYESIEFFFVLGVKILKLMQGRKGLHVQAIGCQ